MPSACNVANSQVFPYSISWIVTIYKTKPPSLCQHTKTPALKLRAGVTWLVPSLLGIAVLVPTEFIG